MKQILIMCEYLILQHPGHNRVYYNLAGELALAELKIAVQRLSVNVTDVKVIEIAKVRYLSIITEGVLSSNDFQILSRLSFVFSMYQLDTYNNKNILVPIQQYNYKYVDDKISSMLKYPGKTNELFTKMMINVALLSSDFNYDDAINLLDPVSGRGTTLFEACIYGFNAYGVELDAKSVSDSILFFKKYIQTERYKNTTNKRMIYGKDKTEAVYVNEFEYARLKEEFKETDNRKVLAVVNGTTVDSDKYFKPKKFHLIVGDLPYGIAHGNKTVKNKGGITRNPSELLHSCVEQWKRTLKVGGVIVIAWNSFVVSRTQLQSVFAEAGLEVMKEPPYNGFEHMVDKSIKRDIIVAKRVN
ncbi:TRM11 family SAM-dependent methyltransferase [Saccharicrinis aurantiacus]|uniref:TRM11 family SAM-dependent methyltransferase n=1 Tax=Saccharicrinis aurantiacus TaxID=1849719 RepID=UPI002491A953|nr:hypothetical protein [Saccharicrinis aurantiacus]